MGLSPSKRLKTALANSNEFKSACDSAYTESLEQTQHAFPGVLPHQLPAVSTRIHASLSTAHKHPLILKWVPSPPNRIQIDSAFRAVTSINQSKEEEEDAILGPAQFKEWALVLFAEAAVGNAERAVLMSVPLGVAGIIVVGAVIGTGKGLTGAAVGVYALGVVTSAWVSLSV